jgi:hypothetical protein
MFLQKPKHKKWPIIILILFVLLFSAGIYAVRLMKNFSAQNFITSAVIEKIIGQENKDLAKILPVFFGLDQPITYLVLFLNNTEIRPGGGFIGSYAVLSVDKGKINLVVVEGTETLDSKAPMEWKSVPPAPISDHLKVKKWFFRDSNWSPDFEVDAKRALEFYTAEGGTSAGNIDAVIAITPTVLEKLLELIGPVSVQNISFDSSNVVEKLEFEVEYGYDDKGIIFADRKQILKPFMNILMQRIKTKASVDYIKFLDLFKSLAQEKHIMVYAVNPDAQKIIEKLEWGGNVVDAEGDYLLWVDANLAALKTDYVMDKILSYTISKDEKTKKYIATATMKYIHNGKFDWRTTRYRTYARIFVPNGSELLSSNGAMKWDRTAAAGSVDQGQELEKQWFGAFISIEPGDSKELSFSYILPENISDSIDDGVYTLYVQKQLGVVENKLTLDLNFDKSIKAAFPAESADHSEDNRYQINSDLRLDRSFKLEF